VTALGAARIRYSREIEAAPSRFTGTDAYTLWAARADAWAAALA
jgi:hypothetical protein